MPKRRPPQEWIQTITTVADGLPYRDGHEWSKNKLGILTSYFQAYARACQKARNFYFVDAMAGSGLYHIQETDEWLLGSTPIALATEPRFAKCLAMELDPTSVAALSQRVERYGDRAKVIRGDVNADLIEAMARYIPRRGPSFVLLDPEGVELHWATIRAASQHRLDDRKSELLILFATEGLNRMLPREAGIELHNEMALNLLFPPNASWRETWERRRRNEITPAEARALYVEDYMQGLLELGYKHVLPRKISRASGALVYHLVFASDHEAGKTIMKAVFERMHPSRDQQQLF